MHANFPPFTKEPDKVDTINIETPRQMFSKLQEESMEQLHLLVKDCQQKLGNGLNYYLTALVEVMDYQGNELALYRELEKEMNDSTLTEEKYKDWKGRIDALRVAALNRKANLKSVPK